MLEVKEENGKIYSPVRKKWLVKTPEESIRQQFLCVLVNNYGYMLEQIKEEENLTGRGSAQARADFVIYRNTEDLRKNNNPLIIAEIKAEHIAITEKEFLQGEYYARIYNAPFFVTHNGKETKFWRVKQDKSPGYREEIEDIPKANANEKEIKALYAKLKVFREKEFKQVLDACHNIIRNNEKHDAAAAFDEIAKVLFMKVYAERNLKKGKENVFSLDWVENAETYNPDYLNFIFEKTKTEFGKSVIFAKDEKIKLRTETTKQIIQKLERYNLSETSVDTKGIAFENFLGTTFRGDLGQFFTPRPVVEFMIDMLDPQPNQRVCDPACGSGGFLIRFFQKVQERILNNLNAEYQEQKQQIETDQNLTEAQKLERVLGLFQQLEQKIDILNPETQLWNLANRCIFGTDANERMARIAKMNMIMHGDGHGGIHHHDGLLDVADIQNESFDIILTNPPFGTIVEDKLILSQFEVGKNAEKQVQENLFLERFLNLLKPKGKLGVVVPESVLNNPSSSHVREMIEERAFISSVISLPQETFLKSGASIKCSLLFIQKFTEQEAEKWRDTLEQCYQEIFNEQIEEREELKTTLGQKISAKDYDSKEDYQLALDASKEVKKEAQERLKELENELSSESRKNARIKFNYSIFVCEPEKVGITTLGIGGENHLSAVLSDYRYKTQNYSKSALVNFAEFERWDVKSFFQKDYGKWDKNYIKSLQSLSKNFRKQIPKQEAIEKGYLIIAKINKKGELFLRKFEEIHDYKGNFFLVPPNSFIFSKINAKIGCFYFHKPSEAPFLVSSEYPVIQFDNNVVEGKYVELALRFGIAQELFNAKVAGMAKPRIGLSEFLQIPIPVPNKEKQKEQIELWEKAQELRRFAELAIKTASENIQTFILGED